MSDARRGGVRPRLGKELQKLDQIVDHDFFVLTCSLHAFNLILASPVSNYISSRGIGKMNMMQLLYTSYTNQEEFD